MFAIMETAIVFFASQTLETAVADSARLIMTGQAQTQSFTQAQFKTAVCAKILGLFDCAERHQDRREDLLVVRRRSTIAKPIDANGNLQTNFGYHAGRRRATSSWCA